MRSFITRRAASRAWRSVLFVAAGLAGLVTGYLMGVPTPAPVALATCGTAFSCGQDTTVTSALIVDHEYTDPDTHVTYPVEPDDTDTWEVTTKWYSAVGGGCSCQLINQAVAYVDVTWSDITDTWSATCTSGCGGNIAGVSVCTYEACPSLSDIDHSWAYMLLVNISSAVTGSCGMTQGLLREVVYAAGSLDSGDVIDSGDCTEDIAVSPMQIAFGATDNGSFECAFSCGSVTGPSETIEYEE